MWGKFFLILLAAAIAITSFTAAGVGALAADSTNLDNSASSQPESVSAADSHSPLPECIIDLDCGADNQTGYVCRDGYIVTEHITPRCVGAGSRQAYCANETSRDVLDWCRPDEECVPGKRVCQPKATPPLPITGQVVETSNCDRPDSHCTVQCTSNASCGIPRWGEGYCGDDGSVYQDYVTYECKNPRGFDSYCKQYRITRRSDYCGPLNKCREGLCYDDQDRMPYAYYDGGFFGSKRTRFVNEYDCAKGDTCYNKDSPYVECIGTSCYKVVLPDNV